MFWNIIMPSSSSVRQSFVLGCCTHLWSGAQHWTYIITTKTRG